MKGLKGFLFLIAALSFNGCGFNNDQGAAGNVRRLELVAALPVDMPSPLEPSGLTLHEGNLYAVADKDDRNIYRVEITDGSARLVQAIRFNPPGTNMDWEGITCDPAGNFYLVSESYGRILQVRPNGSCGWISPDLRTPARPTGLFAKDNAGLEGIAWLGPNHWLGAVEREPRGLVEFKIAGGKDLISSSVNEHSPYSSFLPLLRLPDYSGLDTDDGNIYALFRGAHLLVRLQGSENTLREAEAWSYKHIETDPTWAYLSQTYGQAEGLVVDGRDVFIILDNNLGGKQSDPNDGRPLLFIARIPD